MRCEGLKAQVLPLVIALVFPLPASGVLCAEAPSTQLPSAAAGPAEAQDQPWLEPIPVPADPELEAQIQQVQEALSAIDRQMVRRKDGVNKTQDPATRAKLYDELEQLRKEREDLEGLLHDLVEEAKVSERTALDEALARARWLERRQEYLEKKEENLRDRQQ